MKNMIFNHKNVGLDTAHDMNALVVIELLKKIDKK